MKVDHLINGKAVAKVEITLLEPAVLTSLVTEHIEAEIDGDLWERRKERIDEVKTRLSDTADEYEEEGI